MSDYYADNNAYADNNSELDPCIDFETYKFEEIEEHYKGLEPAGYELLVRVFIQPTVNKTKGGILLPPTAQSKMHESAKFTNNTGLVVKRSRAAYKDSERYQYTGEYCQVGDWVTFDRHSGVGAFGYKDWTTLWLKEDQVRGIVEDPRNITRLTR